MWTGFKQLESVCLGARAPFRKSDPAPTVLSEFMVEVLLWLLIYSLLNFLRA